jgi:hypothetical protein
LSSHPTDPVRELLRAALCAAQHLHGDDRADRAVRVIVECEAGLKLIDLAIPRAMTAGTPAATLPVLVPEVPVFVPGWSFANNLALFDGKVVAVGASRVKLLKALAEATAHLTAAQLTDDVFDKTDIKNTRFHLGKLEDELKKAFPDFEGKIIEGGQDGYRLILH